VVAQVGRPATAATIRLARRAVEEGAAAIAAVVPYFFALDDDQLMRHFVALTEAVAPVPLLVYNIPARTDNDVTPALLDGLLSEGVAGLKDSTKSFERHLEYLDVAARHDGSRIYMGSDSLALDALRAGAQGVMSAVANVIPARVIALRDAVASEDWGLAKSIQDEILALRAETQRGRPLVALKDHVARRLDDGGKRYPSSLRPPLG
jgi:4-hydroxy-tetrahydrodipicolinate synthase